MITEDDLLVSVGDGEPVPYSQRSILDEESNPGVKGRVWVEPYDRNGEHVDGYWKLTSDSETAEITEHKPDVATTLSLWDSLLFPDEQSDYYDPVPMSIVADHGRAFFDFLPIDENEQNTEMGMCYMNAAHVSLARDDLTYVEGYARAWKGNLLEQIFQPPIHHAWLVDDEGRVYDPTWGNQGTAYIGVPVARDHLYSELMRRNIYGLFVDGNVEYPPEDMVIDIGVDPRTI